jgi:phospholipid/cholesterol/gamma-HCH transport system ATP-binding protein
MTEVMQNRRIEGAVGDYAPPQDVKPLVQAVDLWTEFGEGESRFAVHQDLNFDVYPGEILALVGAPARARRCCCARSWGCFRHRAAR